MEPQIRHVLKSQQFSVEFLNELFEKTDQLRQRFENSGRQALRSQSSGKLMYYLFWESSTRTKFSFTTAARHLGMDVEGTENAGEFSSAAKGETLADTVRVLSSYAPDVIVMRHKIDGAAEEATRFSQVPIINAGDGRGQHPTQALLDLYTLRRELARLSGLRVVIGGDLLRGRTVRSLAYLLSKFKDNYITFVSAPQLRAREDIKQYLREKGLKFSEIGEDFRHAFETADAVYWTRTQTERIESDEQPLPQAHAKKFVIDKEKMSWLPKTAIVMHPLPRVDEIDARVDTDPRAAYFRQAENGMFVRMALLLWVLKQW